MSKKLRITLNTYIYQEPTEEDVREAKDYVLRMSHHADILGDRVMEILREAAERIVIICYKYNIRKTSNSPPTRTCKRKYTP